jgi:hypothetical protein
MTRRYYPMSDYYVRSVINAELRRAKATGRNIDRVYLISETGIPRTTLERRISAAARELRDKESAAALASQASATVGGAKPGPGPSPKETDPDPFAPPTKTGTGKAKP